MTSYCPLPADDECKLRCVSAQTGDQLVAEKHVDDGTLCSYDDQDDICIKGKCVVRTLAFTQLHGAQLVATCVSCAKP